MKKKNSEKVRVDFRKNRGSKTRKTDITREFHQDMLEEDEEIREERISGKGAITRQRTICIENNDKNKGVSEEKEPECTKSSDTEKGTKTEERIKGAEDVERGSVAGKTRDVNSSGDVSGVISSGNGASAGKNSCGKGVSEGIFAEKTAAEAESEEWRANVKNEEAAKSEDSAENEGRTEDSGAGKKRAAREEERSHMLAVTADARPGLVLRVHGLNTFVEDDETGRIYVCAVRRLLKTLATDQRHVVVAGDRVLFRPVTSGGGIFGSPENETEYGTDFGETLGENPGENPGETLGAVSEGFIERIEPRTGCLSRTSWKRQHILVANVQQLLIVTSLAEPTIKWNLIDRMIIMSEKAGIRPIICVNKIDLASPVEYVPDFGVYERMGYEVLLVSAEKKLGIERLRDRIQRKGLRSVVAGQSGVGKSSLLNAIEDGLALRTSHVSGVNQKGRHTTTAARLIRLSSGAYVVDTPGIRSFDLWDVIPSEVCGYYREIAPFSSLCKFQDCTHTHEEECAVRDAVADGLIDARRFESMLQIRDSRNLPEDWE